MIRATASIWQEVLISSTITIWTVLPWTFNGPSPPSYWFIHEHWPLWQTRDGKTRTNTRAGDKEAGTSMALKVDLTPKRIISHHLLTASPQTSALTLNVCRCTGLITDSSNYRTGGLAASLDSVGNNCGQAAPPPTAVKCLLMGEDCCSIFLWDGISHIESRRCHHHLPVIQTHGCYHEGTPPARTKSTPPLRLPGRPVKNTCVQMEPM